MILISKISKKFPIVQCIAYPKVRKCLEKLDKGVVIAHKKVQEHVKGIFLHLEVIWAFWEVFNEKGTLFKRMKLSSFVVYMIYFGTKYICHVNHGHFLKDNWLTKKSIIDCLISCHSIVLYIMMMCDLFPNLLVALHEVG